MSTDHAAHLAQGKDDEMEMLNWTMRQEKFRKRGSFALPPPLGLARYPELWERAWGWDTILPYHSGMSWSGFKDYLQEFYKRNSGAYAAAQFITLNANDNLRTLAELCIKMETELMSMLTHWEAGLTHLVKARRNQQFDRDYIALSNKISSCVHQMIDVDCSEFPLVTFALKCITQEAFMMCTLMHDAIITSDIIVSNSIRKCALSLMTYNGPESLAAAAIMMSSVKEANRMCAFLRKEREDRYGEHIFRESIRDHTLVAMVKLCDECSSAEDCTRGGSTAGKLMIHESDKKDCSKINNKPEQSGESKRNIGLQTSRNASLAASNVKESLEEDEPDNDNRTGQPTGMEDIFAEEPSHEQFGKKDLFAPKKLEEFISQKTPDEKFGKNDLLAHKTQWKWKACFRLMKRKAMRRASA